jgi:hypothetical protein
MYFCWIFLDHDPGSSTALVGSYVSNTLREFARRFRR